MDNSAIPNASRRFLSGGKFLFWALVCLAALVLDIAVIVALDVADYRWFGGNHKLAKYGGSMILPCYFLAFGFATAMCRRLGVIEGRRVEVLRRAPGSGPAAPTEMVELRTPRSLWTGLAIVMIAVGALIGTAVATLPAVPGTQVYGYGAAAVCAALGLLMAGLGRVPDLSFTARVDGAGVTALQGFRRRTAAWAEIAAVEIVTVPAAPGAAPPRVYTLKDVDDKRLMTFNLLFVPPADQERFEQAVRRAFTGEPPVAA